MAQTPLKPLVLLEHVNLAIPSRSVGLAFYVEALGCRLNPKGSNERQIHVNCGCSQFHLPFLHSIEKKEPVTVPHVIDGHLELNTKEDLREIMSRLEALFPLEGCTVSSQFLEDGRLQVTGPYGNSFILSRVNPAVVDKILAQGGHPGGSEKVVGISRVVLNTSVGSVAKIAQFYESVLGCPAVTDGGRCLLPFSAFPGQELVFQEVQNESLDSRPNNYDLAEAKRFHIALYLPDHSAFLNAFNAAKSQDIIFVNERFQGGPIEFASSVSEEEAEESGQFRLKDLKLDQDEAFYTLEHEVRSPRHVSFPLVDDAKDTANPETTLCAAVVLLDPRGSWPVTHEASVLWKEALSGEDSVDVSVFFASADELPRKELLSRPGSEGGFDILVVAGKPSPQDYSLRAPWADRVEKLLKGLLQEAKSFFPRIICTGNGTDLATRALGGESQLLESVAFGAETISAKSTMKLFPLENQAPSDEVFRLPSAQYESKVSVPASAIHLAGLTTLTNEVFFVPITAGDDKLSGVFAFQSRPELSEANLLSDVLPQLESDGLVDAKSATAALEALNAPLCNAGARKLLAAFAHGKAPFSVNESQDASKMTKDQVLRSTYCIEMARMSAEIRKSKLSTVRGTANVAAGLTKTFKRADEPWAEYLTEGDLDVDARTDAFLRGEVTAREAAALEKPERNLGSRAALLETTMWPESEAKVIKGAHTSNILCCSLLPLPEQDETAEPIILATTGSSDRTVKAVYLHGDFAEHKCGDIAYEAQLEAPVTSVISRGNFTSSEVIVATMDGKVQQGKVTSVSSGFKLQVSTKGLIQHSKLVTAVAASEDGRWVASASRDNSIHIYEFVDSVATHWKTVKCSGCPEALEFCERFGAACLAVSIRDEHCLMYLCVAQKEKELKNETTGSLFTPGSVLRTNLNATGDSVVSFTVLDLAVAPFGLGLIAAATDKSRIIVLRTGSAEQVRTLFGHSCGDYGRPRLAWDPTGRFLATNSEQDVAVHVWYVPTGESVAVLRGHQQSVRDVTFLERENGPAALVSVSFDRTIRVWDPLMK